MKTCPQCKKQYPDESQFCVDCGIPLNNDFEPSSNDLGQNQFQSQNQYQQPAPVVNQYDHTAEFDAQDISDNKIMAMAAYLLGMLGIIITLLAASTSKYAAFHVRQALKLEITSLLISIVTAVLCITIIVPIAGVVCLGIVFVLKIICFVQVCMGKAVEPAIIRNFKFFK